MPAQAKSVLCCGAVLQMHCKADWIHFMGEQAWPRAGRFGSRAYRHDRSCLSAMVPGTGLIQSPSQASLPGLSAWVEVGGIAPSLCLKAPPPQPIST